MTFRHFLYFTIFFILGGFAFGQNIEVYKDSKATAEARANDLVEKMTLEEKVGQLSTLLGWKMYEKTENRVTESKALQQAITDKHIGALWGTLRADPWTQKTLKNGLDPRQAAQETNAIQKYAIENSRLGIPLFLAEEAMHGHMAIGTTVFPSGIGQGSTWDPELLTEMGSAIAEELRVQGAHIGYGPILDLAREPRWSRVEETFGEDPYLTAQLGLGVIKGFQGEGFDSNNSNSNKKVISTLKHFAAYGVSEGGHNGNAVHMGVRELFQDYLYPFREAIDFGALSVMTAYSSIDGIPSTAHRELLQQVLRDQWRFKGFVVSDLASIEGIMGSHHVAATSQEAAALAINAGVDADLGGNGFGSALLKAVKSGKVDENRLNEAVKRVLLLKFQMGLFEHPYVDVEKVEKNVRTTKHVQLARKVAQKSIILLKNEENLLPLKKSLKHIAVIGPNADVQYNQLGDYTAPQAEENIVTVLEGIQEKMPNAVITYAKGTAIRDTTQTDIATAVNAAKNADVAIVVLGGSSARDFKTEYLETGAATVSSGKDDVLSDMESGEGYDRSTLNLMGKQLELLQAVYATATPTVLVLIKGRPLLLNWPSENIPAILDAWYPGQEGGNAIADVLFGDYNPAGRLPISVPKNVGQLPVYYDYLGPERRDYVEGDGKPLYPFGYGLSFSDFEYKNLKVSETGSGEGIEIKINFNLKNTSTFDGEEVAQLYIRDVASSVVTPVKQLKAFKRLLFKAGEEKTVQFTLTPKDLSLFNTEMKQVAEAGEFQLMLGASSEDIRLKETFKLSETILLNDEK
ncbi:glycoside hydrolase family 3 N-terminal domain-containing protein [Flavimarina sp. Hel_I_48]|uniref:glycoside hydrolase family 3 N-terminal domain-containing protein n=1 Tax=Flavimarina sp. Hel_I_48 TaxID=1392488 RepID=UPI000561F7DD|nr:glycoside hydrolase family 3 N-terminal domain-containing protein [Flavimarina sp. Hel_I_48]